MNVQKEISLSKNALKELLVLEIENKKAHSVDYKLQVIGIRKNDQAKSAIKGNLIYTASLSDGDFKYTGFVIMKLETEPVIDEGDILEILKVCTARLNTQKNRMFIIKKYYILVKNLAVIGEPELLKDESGGSYLDRVLPALNDANNNINNNSTGKNPGTNTLLSTHNHTTDNINTSGVANIPQEKESTPYNFNSYTLHPHSDTSQNLTPSSKGKFTYQPLKTLTTFSKDICILIRCIKKTAIRSFNGGSGGTGILFSFNVIDQEGSEMQITCFNRACEKFYNLIKENCVYEIIGGYIKLNEKKYTCIKSDYTMIIYENAKIAEKEDDCSIKETHYNYVKISEIANIPPNSIIDIFAYVIEAPEKIIKNTKIGEQPIRKIIIGDDSEFKIEFTLWKSFTDLDIIPGTVISVKAVKIGDYNGRSLSTVDHSVINLDPVGKETTELKSFCQNFQEEWSTFNEIVGGGVAESTLSSPIHTIREVLALLDTHESEDKIPIIKIKATICTIIHTEKNFYPGCPDKTCKKKLYFLSEETWQCNYCKKQTNKPFYYYRFAVRIKDYSGEHWLDIFGDFGIKLFKINCEEYKDLVYNKNEEKLNEITNHLEFKTFYFIVKPKMQTYNNISKKKLNCYKVETIEPSEESRRILKNLNDILNKK